MNISVVGLSLIEDIVSEIIILRIFFPYFSIFHGNQLSLRQAVLSTFTRVFSVNDLAGVGFGMTTMA